MATTTYRILGDPILPYTTPHGTVTVFNSDGTFTWVPNNNYYNSSPVAEFQTELLCDNVFNGLKTEFVTVVPPVGVPDITNNIGGAPNLTPVCGGNVTYKEKITWTPSSPVPTPITRLWSVSSGGTIVSGGNTDTVIVGTNAGYGGTYNLTLTITTPVGVLVKTIILDAVCGAVVDDSYSTPMNTALIGNLSINDTPCE